MVCWVTTPIWLRRELKVTSLISVPSIVREPLLTSKNRGIRLTSVDLPPPLEPTTARISPASTFKFTPLKTSISFSYLNLTSLNSIASLIRGSSKASFFSATSGFISRTSKTLSAAAIPCCRELLIALTPLIGS